MSTFRCVLEHNEVVFLAPSDPFLRPFNYHRGRLKGFRQSFEHVAFDDDFEGADTLILRDGMGISGRNVEKVSPCLVCED